MSMVTAVDEALAGAVDFRLAQGIVAFVHGDLTEGHRDQARPRVRVPAALSADSDRIPDDVDVGVVLRVDFDVPLVCHVALHLERWEDAFECLHGAEAGGRGCKRRRGNPSRSEQGSGSKQDLVMFHRCSPT